MSNNNYNFYPTLDGLNNVIADNITASSINSANISFGTATVSEIDFTNGTTTSTMIYDNSDNLTLTTPSTANYFSINGQLSINGYSNVKTALDGMGIIAGSNAWTGTNTFNTNLPTSTKTVTSSSQLTNKSYVDTAITNNIATLKSSPNVWSSTNSFSSALPTCLFVPTNTTDLTNKNYVDNQISGITTNILSGTNTWTGTNTFNSNLPTSTITPSLTNELTNKNYVDTQISGIINLIPANNAWTGTNTFNTHLPTSGLIPSSQVELTPKGYVDLKVSGLLGSANTWTGTNTFNINLPTSTATPTTTTQLTTKTYVDTQVTAITTNLLIGTNSWTGNNAFDYNLPTSILYPTTVTQMITLQSLQDQLYNSYDKYNQIKDDFIEGFVNTSMAYTNSGSGTTSTLTSIQNHPGIIRFTCGNLQNAGLVPQTATNVFFWGDVKIIEFVWRYTGDATCLLEFGMTQSYTVSTNSVRIVYTTTPTNAFKFFVNGTNVYTTTLGGGNFTGGWVYGRITATTAGNADFFMNAITAGVSDSFSYTGGAITTTLALVPYLKLTNQNANSKTLDIDYISISYQTNRS